MNDLPHTPLSAPRDIRLSVSDATLALLLAAKIHGTNQAVKATAKRCAKQLPRSKRSLMFTVIDSPQPLQLVGRIARSNLNSTAYD